MDFDYSIENLTDAIPNPKSRQYFQEVYQTYINRNYRSSTVMLYSVLVCDLVFKLRDLRDIYSDPKADKILEEIEKMQAANPTSPEWESKLIELIRTRTNLLESSDIVAIESLQKFRHLSAHPVLSNSDLLFSPNKETVQALIRNILEGILTNPPFFSNKIFDTMLNDLVEVKDSVYEDEALEKYVVSRYVSRLKPNDFHKVFRSLWKIVYVASDEKSLAHGNLVYRVLGIFTSQRKSHCLELIKNETSYYSNITKESSIGSLIHYLANFPEIYNLLEPSLQLLIKSQSKDGGEMEFVSWFLHKSIKDHFENLGDSLVADLPHDSFAFMETVAGNNGDIKDYIDYLLKYFNNSNSFDQSSNRIRNIFDCLKDKLTLQQAKRLLKFANNNSQIYHSWYVPDRIKELVKSFEEEIDKKKYSNIFKHE